MKKMRWAILAVVLCLFGSTALAFDAAEEITVLSREDGSGTRGAFVELMGIEEKNDAGEKIDRTTLEAIITNSTSVMLTSVAGDEAAIGYVSLGSLGEGVKALAVDDVLPSVEAVKSGEYKVSRPFLITTGEAVDEATQDFIDFMLCAQGQQIIEDNGYIAAVEEAPNYEGNASGKIVVAGSSSVTPVMEKLKEAYIVLNPEMEIEIQQSDSTTGLQSLQEGICSIAMVSRDLKDTEREKGLEPATIALDGIAVIVHPDNPLTGLSSETIRQIFTGEILTWTEAGAE